jgi:hypothetical protein
MFFPPRPRANAPPTPRQQQQNLQQLQRLPNVNEITTIIIQSVGTFARKHKLLTGWYLLGVIVLLYVSSYNGRSLTNTEIQQYNTIMNSIDLQLEYDAVDKYWNAKNAYQQSKGWFGFLSCDSTCQRMKRRYELAQQDLQYIRNEGNARMSDAKAIAGITSNIGLSEIKDSFWNYFQSGKRFAKRQSMWDIMFMGIRTMSRGRDESTMEFIIKVLLQVLLNFSLGLIMAVVFFIMGIWNIISSYRPHPIMAMLTFLAATAGATSFVITYLLAIYGAAAGSVYGLAKLTETTIAIQNQQQQQQQRLNNNNRIHYD